MPPFCQGVVPGYSKRSCSCLPASRCRERPVDKILEMAPKSIRSCFPANQDIANVLGRSYFDYDNACCYFSFLFFGSHMSGCSDHPISGFSDPQNHFHTGGRVGCGGHKSKTSGSRILFCGLPIAGFELVLGCRQSQDLVKNIKHSSKSIVPEPPDSAGKVQKVQRLSFV